MNALFVLIKKSWLVLSQTAIWLLSLFSPFLYSPPANALDLELGHPDTGYNAARFGLTLVAAVIFFTARRKWRQRFLWGIVAMAALLAAGCGFFSYQNRLSDWTTVYNGGLVVHGEELTPASRAFAEANQISLTPIDHARLLANFAGSARDVWTDLDVINTRWRTLVLLYLATVSTLSLCVVACLQTTKAK